MHSALRFDASHDSLTMAWNRAAILERLNEEVVRSQRSGSPVGVAMADLDHFKAVNDTHGHLAGDAALKQLATRIAGQVRAEEVFARIGGEEFAVLCPETDAPGAVILAEKLRAACADAPLDCAGVTISVTCSFGVAEFGGTMSKLEDLMRAADSALYRAKGWGRNRVCAEG
jgi:diguanylate cyclase (GGDEF)-like protein